MRYEDVNVSASCDGSKTGDPRYRTHFVGEHIHVRKAFDRARIGRVA